MDLIKKQINKYLVLEKLDEGGMGAVYKAINTNTGELVAIKVMHPALANSKEAITRFIREISVSISLKHPNIINVYEVLKFNGTLAYVMEFLQGKNFNKYIKERKYLSEEEIINIFSQILVGLDHAHSNGIVHRDIKPQNIFITNENKIKILDFGIAKPLYDNMDLTRTQAFLGTPFFASPELIMSPKNIDWRSDIYSVGVMLYYAIEGKLPYNEEVAKSPFLLQKQIIEEPLPPLSRLKHLENIVKKATEKNPKKRFQTCGEFYVSLQNNTSKNIINNNSSKIKVVKLKKAKENKYKDGCLLQITIILILLGILKLFT